MNRRRFLQAFTVGLTGPGSMVGWETLRHDLMATIGGDTADLAEWEAIAWEYGSTYTTTPPVTLLHELATDMLVAKEQLQRMRDDSQRRGLQRVVAQLATYTAQTAGNLGHNRDSARWWRIARHAADASGRTELRVWVRGRQVIRGLYEHRPLEVLLALADEAIAITSHPSTGNVMAGRAQALAMLGRAEEARQTMRDLYDLVDRLPAHITSDMASMLGWPEYRLRHTESFVYTHIGDHKRAEVAQDRALSLYPDRMFRERAQVQLHRAMRLIKSGDPGAGSGDAYATITDLPESHRIDPVLELARWAAAKVPAAEHQRPEATELRQLLAAPSAPPGVARG